MTTGEGPRAIVTSAYDALARGEDEKFLDHMARRVEWLVPGPPDHPATGMHVGGESLLFLFAKFSAVAELTELVIESVVGDGDVYVVLGREKWRVRATDREFETLWANAVTVKDGLIDRVTVYADTSNESLAYAGT
jgi:ketosteroid isomerase-like protein